MVGNPTAEQIDERILGLLGLEDEYEMSYEEYVRHLKEAMVASRMSESKFSTEESELITNEWKRVKDKKGRLKPKKKKITVEGLGIGKGFTSPLKINQQKLLPPDTKGVKKDTTKLIKDKKDSGDNVLLRISSTLDSILQTFTDLNKENRKRIEKERVDAEQKARSEKEKQLESKPFEKIKKAFDIITKPFQSIWDIFANFIKNVILGRIVVKLLDWFGDPKNQGKVKSLTRFLVDFGPALLAGFVLFGTRFGKAVRFLSSIVLKGIWRLSKFAIPKILKFITRNPIAAGIALVTAGAWVPAMFPGTVNEQETKTQKTPGTSEEKIKALEKQKANLNVFEKLQGKGSEINEQIEFLKTGKTKSYGFSGGGFANFGKMFGGSGFNPTPTLLESENQEPKSNGFVSGQQGVDKVPAMLSDGEFVMSVGAVNKYGAETLEAMNAAGGGTNKPKIVNGKTYAVGGGRVGEIGDSRYSVGKLRDDINKFLREKGGGGGSNFDIGNPKTWNSGGGGGFRLPNLPSGGGIPGGFRLPNLPSGGGIPGGFNPEKYIPEQYRGDYNRIKEKVGSGLDFAGKKVAGIRQKVIDDGYLSKRGRYEGAAKAQGNNFLSEMLPNLPGVSNINKAVTESYLTKIGMGRNTKNIDKKGNDFTSAFYGGSSGIDRAYNVGQLQVNKMSNESRNYYLKKIKARLAAGTIKSGDMIDAYDLDAKNPIRREQGSVRFIIGPDGSPYLGDTYGFDPQKGGKGKGKINLGTEQKRYDEQVAKFQSGKGVMGKMAKFLNLKPLADATEGGEKVQFALALRNKIFGYDPEKEAMAKLSMRFKTKVQVEELRKSMNPEELKQLLALSKDQLTLNERTLLQKAKKKNELDAKKAKEQSAARQKNAKNKKALEAKRPWWDKMGMFGGASAQQKKESEKLRSTGMAGRYIPGSQQKQIKTTQPAKVSKPKTPIKPAPKPPAKPKPRVVVAGGGMGGGRGSGSNRSGSATIAPSFKPNHGRTNTAAKTLGVNRR